MTGEAFQVVHLLVFIVYQTAAESTELALETFIPLNVSPESFKVEVKLTKFN